jgi:hypothetical protein
VNDITIIDTGRSLTAKDIRAHVNLIQEVMKAVMVKDTHFGVIPGCKLPSLYKAGSEVLLSTFRIAVSVRVEDLSTEEAIRYRVTTTGTHQGSGVIVGEGIGECSSDETKYKWRTCYVKKEFENTPENRRRIKYKEYQGRESEQMEVRTDPADVANTILKMAKKRAQIDLTLTATAASDIFTQDIEDLPEEIRADIERPERTPNADQGKPLSGAWDSLDGPTQAGLLALSKEVKALLAKDEPIQAYERIQKDRLGSEEKMGLWTLLESKEKSALNKAADALKVMK